MTYYQVIWHQLYDLGSCRDNRKLYAVRNLLDERNVTVDPHNNIYTCGEFVDRVLDAYLICGALEYFGMENVDDEPTMNGFANIPTDMHAKREYVFEVFKKLC